jgi:hypothetical protein
MVAFRCYDPTTDGSGGIHRWYDRDISPEARSAIDGALELMAREAKLDGHPSFKPLRGKCSGLAEIKIDVPSVGDGKQNRAKRRKKQKKKPELHIRLLGPNNPPNAEFILLTGFLKKGNTEYGPMGRQAHNRHRGVQRDERRAKDCLFP